MKKINTIIFDSLNSISDLCKFGEKTDKSPHNILDTLHKHPYTPLYSLLFCHLRNKDIMFCELGIATGGSIEMWRKYFTKNSIIYGFELDDSNIDIVEKLNLNNVIIKNINTSDINNMEYVFKETNVLFDIIVEDTNHELINQKNVVSVARNYLKSGGILIIEDIYKRNNADVYEELLNEYLDSFDLVYYIVTDHNNKFSGDWNNDAVIVLIKK